MMYLPLSSTEAFTTAIIQCFNTGNIGMMRDIMSRQIPLDDLQQEDSYCTILNYLQVRQQKLLTILNDLHLRKKIKTGDLEEQANITFIYLLNYLPDEFNGFRSEYCNELVKIAKLLEQTDPEEALELMINVTQLNCLPQSKQRAEDFYRQLQNNPAEKKHSSIWVTNSSFSLMVKLIFAFGKRQ